MHSYCAKSHCNVCSTSGSFCASPPLRSDCRGGEERSYNELATDFDEVEYAYRPEYKKNTEQISKIKTQKETLNHSFS